MDTLTQFDELVRQHIDEIYNYARYMTADPDEADDITQKTFISLHENFQTLDRSKPVKQWLFTVAKNKCLDHFKAKKAILFSEIEENELASFPETSVAKIEDQLQNEMELDKIKSIIRQIPLPAREVMLLKYFEDFTFAEIGTILDLPENTVKSHFYRGKQRLFKMLAGETN